MKLLRGERGKGKRAVAYAVIITAILALPLYWLMDRELPVVLHAAYDISSPVVPGEPLELIFEGERFRACPTYVEEEIISSDGLVHTVKERLGRINLEEGDFSTPLQVPTPVDAAPGPALYRSTVQYRCNPIHRIWPITVRREVGFVFAATEETEDRIRSLIWNSLQQEVSPP